ncbi:LysR family substrate-binding domain-containing protein [Streptomyces yaizuensis]|uniref:LysR family substrate-binding domain-containing protein n=1 Tax=Streptomyces yaizuensis TaxID=2989713 RepID=A0ABQ5NRV9_9ACTN|nr:LysR family substrate-binding domain-containing protein [Streptomyces sp. YSPA8]GLF93101.1 LysR family substrate-binding domain-containing protein [Streptomyces sp. YSPA8]
MNASEASPSFRLAYVPGATPAKWVRIWNERLPGTPLELIAVSAAEAGGLLRDGGADAGLVRLPVDRTVFSAIPLYTETTVVVVPKDHAVTAADEVSVADLADDIVLHPLDDTLGWETPPGLPALERPATTADAIELVAAGVGLLVVPQSLARLHHRKDLTYRTVTDAPQSAVALSWREDATTDRVEDLIGIVRGRTVNSTRGRRQDTPEKAGRSGAKPEKKKQDNKQRGGAGGGARQGAAGARGGRSGSGRSSSGGTRSGKPRRRS